MKKLPSIKEIRKIISNHPIVMGLINWTQRKSFPGFFKVPIYDVFVFIRNEIKRFAIVTRANSMAFSFFLSLFPSILVLLTLLPFFSEYFFSYLPGGKDVLPVLETNIEMVMPGNAGDMLFSTIEDITTRPRADLLSFGFLLAMIFASNGMLQMMRSFEKSHEKIFIRRSGIQKRLISIGLTFLLGILLIASVVLVILGNFLIGLLSDYIKLDWFGEVAISFLRYFAIVALFYSVIAVIYRFAVPTVKPFRIFTPGATVATLLSILSSVAFSFYVDNFNTYNKLYGSIGTIIVVMLWMQINCMVLLIGFELNASIAVNRDLKEEIEEES
jgi:membrane protein